MRKRILALILSTAVVLTASAQSKISLGPNAGFGSSWITNNEGGGSKAAGNFGLSLVYSATEHFGIGVDGKYSFEGAKTPGSANGMATIDLNYVRIPVKFLYFFNDYGSRLRPKVGIGPSFGFLTTAKLNDADIKSSFNTFDFGLTALAGLNYRLVKNTWLQADVDYLNGLTKIGKNGNSDSPKNRNLQLNIGVNFGL